MKKFVLVAAITGSLVSGQAIAACTGGTRLNAVAISALLGGNTVCVPKVTPLAPIPMTWQELHEGSSTSTFGTLTDYKRGPGPGPDPSKPVGTWTVAGTGAGTSTITHAYSGGGGTYIYSVHSINVSSGIYGFCPIVGGGPEIEARVKSGGGPC